MWTYCYLQSTGHLVGAGDQLAIVTALPEQCLRAGSLKIAGADLGRRDLRSNGEHGQPRTVAVEQAVDEVEVAGPAAAGADGELTRQMRLGTRREGRDLLVPDMDPFDLTLAAKRVGQPVQAVANNAINPLDTRCGENLRELIRNGFGHVCAPRLQN